MVASPPPEDMKILCPSCTDGAPEVLALTADQTLVRCGKCSSKLRLTTRYVTAVHPVRLDEQWTRYGLDTAEFEGRVRSRRFVAQTGMRLTAATWVTLVHDGGQLVGVADQSASMWMTVARRPSQYPRVQRMWRLLAVVCGVLCALYAGLWTQQVAGFVDDGPRAWAAIVVVAAFVLSPLAWWTVRVAFGDTAQGKRTVPKFRSDDPA